MKCSRCQHDNPGDAKFCLECGRRLALSCEACGTQLPADAKFCKECGSAVGAATVSTAAAVGPAPESYTPKYLAEKILTSKAALELATRCFGSLRTGIIAKAKSRRAAIVSLP